MNYSELITFRTLVPSPRTCFSGNHSYKTKTLTAIIVHPILQLVWTVMPWLKTIQGLTPGLAANKMAWPNPKTIKPNSKNGIEIAGGLIVKGVGAVQNKSGTFYRDKMFTIVFIKQHVFLNGWFVDHQFLDLSRGKISIMHPGKVSNSNHVSLRYLRYSLRCHITYFEHQFTHSVALLRPFLRLPSKNKRWIKRWVNLLSI